MTMCSACGDKIVPDTNEAYEAHVGACWVRKKMREPALPMTCETCGQPKRFENCYSRRCLGYDR